LASPIEEWGMNQVGDAEPGSSRRRLPQATLSFLENMMITASTLAPASPEPFDPYQQLKQKLITEWDEKPVNLLTRVKDYQFPQDCFEVVCFYGDQAERPQRINPILLPIAHTMNLPCWTILRHIA
jgi:hypothetical protein